MGFYLGVDVGTSSTKAVLLDERGAIIQKSSVKNELINPRPGFFEVDALSSWWEGFLSILREFQPYTAKVSRLCISSVCGSFVPVDENLDPTYHAILYGIDTRSVDQIERMNRALGEEYLQKHFAGAFTTQSVLPKILWLKENEEAVYERTKYFVESNNFITARLTGSTCWDASTAFAAKLADLESEEIPCSILDSFGIEREKIPGLKWAVDELGCVTAEASRLTGLPENAIVHVGACDVNAEAMSMLSIFPGDTMAVLGSTLSMLHMMDHYIPLDGFVCGFSVMKGTYRFGVGASSGGLFLHTLDEHFGFEGKPAPMKECPTGLLILPYINGARTPFNDPFAKCTIWGIDGRSERSDYYWAIREAIGYEMFLLDSKMEETGERIETIHLSGGVAQDEEIVQLISDITGKQLVVHRGTNAAYGDALIALHGEYSWDGIRALEGFMELEGETRTITPDETRSGLYRPLRAKFLKLYEAQRL